MATNPQDDDSSAYISDSQFDDISPSQLLGSNYSYATHETKKYGSYSHLSNRCSRTRARTPKGSTHTDDRSHSNSGYRKCKPLEKSKDVRTTGIKIKDFENPLDQAKNITKRVAMAFTEKNPENKEEKCITFSDMLTMKGYKSAGELGFGGYGAVSLIQKLGTQDKFALKVVLFDKTTYSSVREEEAIWRDLDHRNIIKLLDTFTFEDKYCFLQKSGLGWPYLSLFRLSRFGSPVMDTCKQWLHQTCKGLRYMHTSLIAHLDLKLRNLLLTDGNTRVQIADFGISKRMSYLTEKCTTRQGTPGHIAPEVLKGAEYDPFCADVWGLGVVSYHLISGEMPFNREAPLAQLLEDQKALILPFKRLVRRDPRCEDFVRKAFTYIPSLSPKCSNPPRPSFPAGWLGLGFIEQALEKGLLITSRLKPIYIGN